jgi:hypothetical protein
LEMETAKLKTAELETERKLRAERSAVNAVLQESERNKQFYEEKVARLAEELNQRNVEQSKAAEKGIRHESSKTNVEANREVDIVQREIKQRRPNQLQQRQRRKILQQTFFRSRFFLRTLVLRMQTISYSAAKAFGIEIRQFAGAAEQVSQRTGGFAAAVARKTVQAAQHVNAVAEEVALTNAKIHGSSSNLAGSRESLAYVVQLGAEKLYHINDVANNLASQQSKIHSNSLRLGEHASWAHMMDVMKSGVSRILPKVAN